MRDDERYPVAVTPQDYYSAPEVVPEGHPYRDVVDERDKYPSPPILDGTVALNGTDGPTAVPKSPSTVAEQGREEEQGRPAGASKDRRICGYKRRTFILACVLVVVLFAAALIGAVVGVWASKRASADSDSNSATPTGPKLTNPLNATQRNVAACRSPQAVGEDIQFFYNDLSTATVMYKLRWDGTSKAAQSAGLSIAPSAGTPLAAVSTGTNPVAVHLFYVGSRTSSSADIVQAVLNCSSGAAACNTVSNDVISAGISNPANPDTALAAVLAADGTTIRVYYEAQFHHIWELNSANASSTGWGYQSVGGPLVAGGNIAAWAGKNSTFNVVGVTNATLTMRLFTYTADSGPSGLHLQTGAPIDENPGAGWDVYAKLAAAYVPAPQTDTVWFASPASGDVQSVERTAATWSPEDDKAWQQAQGGLAALGWRDQARLLYFNQGRPAMSSASGGSWSPMVYL